MASQSEKSFGARLRKFEDAIAYIQSWANYLPPRQEEQLPQLVAMAEEVTALNNSETAKQAQYQTEVDNRQKMFTGKQVSVDKFLTQIRGAVEAQYGKQSNQAKQVVAAVKNMRKSKLIKLPPDPANPAVEKTVSQSERSYGSQTQYFTDLVTMLEQFGDYSTSTPALTVKELRSFAAKMTNANNAVAGCLQVMQSTRAKRTLAYNVLYDSMRRVKAYAKSQYGVKSQEYKSLTALGI